MAMTEPDLPTDRTAEHMKAMRLRDIARHNAIIASGLKRRLKLFRLGVDPNAKPVTETAKPEPRKTP